MKYALILSTIALSAIPLSTSAQTTTTPIEAEVASPPTTTAVAAQSSPQNPSTVGGWDFTLSVPIWLVGVDGDLTVDGAEIDSDQDASDDVDEFLDSELNGAFALHFEAQKSRLGLLVDAMYLDRTATGTVDATDAEGSLKGFIGELGAIYTLIPSNPDKRGWGMFRLDALGGLRVSALELGLVSDTVDDDVSKTFYDPFVGARLELGLTRWLSARLRGDVGGFGIEAWNTTDFTYNIDTALEFHLARWFDLGLGYRWLSYDLEFGSDSDLNATLSGPVVELKFNF